MSTLLDVICPCIKSKRTAFYHISYADENGHIHEATVNVNDSPGGKKVLGGMGLGVIVFHEEALLHRSQ